MTNRLEQYGGPHYAATFNAGRPQHPALAFPTQHKRKPKRRGFWWAAFWFIMGILFARSAMPADPASEVHAAAMHAKSLPPSVATGALYISLYDIPDADRDEYGKLLSYTLNALSRTRAIKSPDWVVSPVSSTLMVAYIPYYAPSAQEYREWRNACDQVGQTDYHFYLTAQAISVTAEHGKVISAAKPSTVTTYGGWTGLENMRALAYCTQSQTPIIEVQHFILNALTSPNYYGFAGIPDTEDAFLKTLGLQADVIEKLRANAGANLKRSDVTLKFRRAIWSQGPLGGVYSTLDSETADADHDPLRRPVTAGGLAVQFDVSEWFAMGPNSLWRVALFNNKGKRANTVPEKIAKDREEDPHGDGIIMNGYSCITCHKSGGLRSFKDDQARLLTKSELRSYDPNVILRLQEFYDEPRLQRQMAFDRESYEAACKSAAGGMDSKQVAASLASCIRNFANISVTTEVAARECGVEPEEFKAAVVHSHDPWLLDLIEGRDALRGAWSSSFAEAALACATRRAR